MDNAARLKYASLNVPRYTSYPTAADFGVLDDQARRVGLEALHDGEEVSLYIHIPYCTAMCFYCGCHTKVAIRDDVIDSYADIVVRDIENTAQYLHGKPKCVHLHWGGGTPSIIGEDGFLKIMAALHKAFDFAQDGEHAIELDPRSVTPKLAKTLREIGVTRASLGVQDINEKVQQAIGRVQPIETVITSVKNLRDAGIEKINFDLIYGLPHQTVDTIKETCETVAKLNPDRIACFGYAHLPQRRANQKMIDSAILPGVEERLAQAKMVETCFEEMGYVAIGIDHFARPDDKLAIAVRQGKLHRNFQGYTDDDCQILIGFGASSISQFDHGFVQTIVDINQYRKVIANGEMGAVRGILIDEQDKRRAALISELMCNFTVDLDDYRDVSDWKSEKQQLAPLIHDGVAELNGNRITMTEEGRTFVRAVAVLFDAYRQNNTPQFSAAV